VYPSSELSPQSLNESHIQFFGMHTVWLPQRKCVSVGHTTLFNVVIGRDVNILDRVESVPIIIKIITVKLRIYFTDLMDSRK